MTKSKKEVTAETVEATEVEHGKEQEAVKAPVFRLTLNFGVAKLRVETGTEKDLKEVVAKLEPLGATVASRGRASSVKEDELAHAVAEYQNISYERAKEWLDSKEIAQRGFKNRVRKEPAIMVILARRAANEGNTTGLLDELI